MESNKKTVKPADKETLQKKLSPEEDKETDVQILSLIYNQGVNYDKEHEEIKK